MGGYVCSLGFVQVCACVPLLNDPAGMSQGGGQGTAKLSCTSLRAAPQGLPAAIPPELDFNKNFGTLSWRLVNPVIVLVLIANAIDINCCAP